MKSRISFRSRRFQNPRTRRTSQSASRNIRGGQQWRPIAYIPGEPVFTPANHPRVQASYEGWLMDRDRVPGTAGQSYERTYRSPISILISWRCFHKGALLLLLLLPLHLLSSLSCRILPWYNTMNLEACITLSRLFALAGISNQIILKSAPRNREITVLLREEKRNFHMTSRSLKRSHRYGI